MARINEQIAGRLEEAARLLGDQGADPYRVRAYLRAAATVRVAREPLDEVFRQQGLDGLQALPGVGESIARAIRELLTHGRFPMLDRLRGEADPVALLASVPGIGRVLADRLHEELGIETLADPAHRHYLDGRAFAGPPRGGGAGRGVPRVLRDVDRRPGAGQGRERVRTSGRNSALIQPPVRALFRVLAARHLPPAA